jgi:hypothetical protein
MESLTDMKSLIFVKSSIGIVDSSIDVLVNDQLVQCLFIKLVVLFIDIVAVNVA